MTTSCAISGHIHPKDRTSAHFAVAASSGTEPKLSRKSNDGGPRSDVEGRAVNQGTFSRFRLCQPEDPARDVTAGLLESPATSNEHSNTDILGCATNDWGISDGHIDTAELIRTVESDPSALQEETWIDVPTFDNMSWETILLSSDPATCFTFLLQLTSKIGLPEAFGDPLIPPTATPLRLLHLAPSPLTVFGVLDLENVTETDFTSHAIALLAQESAQIRSEILKACPPGSLNHYGRSHSSAAIIPHFFTPRRLEHFLDCYWKAWHPNLPIIHRPRFRPSSTPAALLAAMATIGACHSANELDKEQSKALYADVENMVFRRLQIATGSLEHTRSSRRRLVQALQAAYMVMVYQNWDGRCEADRCKARRQRLSQIVEAVQLLGFQTAKHRDYRTTSLGDFNWERYVEDEEFVRICNWTFLVDSAFVIFYKIAPRLSLRELVMALPSTESCFAASSDQICLFELQKWQYQTGFQDSDDHALYGCIKTFCRSVLPFAKQMSFAHQSTISLFALASAFHVMLFNSDPDLGGVAQYNHIITGLDNWRLVWNRKSLLMNDDQNTTNLGSAMSTGPEMGLEEDSAPMKSGFWQYCPEYWLLAYLLVHQIIKRQQQPFNAERSTHAPGGDSGVLFLRRRSSQSGHDEANQGELHRFMRRYEAGGVVY